MYQSSRTVVSGTMDDPYEEAKTPRTLVTPGSSVPQPNWKARCSSHKAPSLDIPRLTTKYDASAYIPRDKKSTELPDLSTPTRRGGSPNDEQDDQREMFNSDRKLNLSPRKGTSLEIATQVLPKLDQLLLRASLGPRTT